MSKKSKNNSKRSITSREMKNVLPQNIYMVGERVYENKNIYISQSTYKLIMRFTENKLTNESGGILIGAIINELGKTNIIIKDFIEAKYCESTPTTLKFTHETWEYFHKEIGKKHNDMQIVGWIHTHPNFGIFLSEYDRFIHENFFKEEFQIALVVDPIQKNEGFYFWNNNSIEKCTGYYVFEEVGKKLSLVARKPEGTEGERENKKNVFIFYNLIIGTLSLIIMVLLINIFNNTLIQMRKETDKIESNIQNISQFLNQITQPNSNNNDNSVGGNASSSPNVNPTPASETTKP